MPYQSAGLDKSIPWYQTIGNHDQYWCGTLLFNDYARSILVGNTVLDIDLVDTPPFPTFDGRGYYMGVIDGKTEYGTIIGAGPVETMAAPIIAADRNRRCSHYRDVHVLELDERVFQHHFRTEGPRIHAGQSR